MESIDKSQASIESPVRPQDGFSREAAIDSQRSVELLDMEAIQRLQSLNSEKDPDFFSHLVAAFLSFGQKNILQMNDALTKGDWPAMARYAHALKGSCANFGALHAVGLCKDMEQRITDQQWESVPYLAERMTTEFKLITHRLNTITASMTTPAAQ